MNKDKTVHSEGYSTRLFFNHQSSNISLSKCVDQDQTVCSLQSYLDYASRKNALSRA